MTGMTIEKEHMTTDDPLIGQQLGDYKLMAVIGLGGMGRVYRGYDEKLQRYTAVKVFDAKGVIGDQMDEYRERFQREARSVARLRHPNIVDVYQFGQSGSLYYMAMTLVQGRDLRTVLKDRSAKNTLMSHEQILRILADVASALDYAHAEGVIHRDVKPSNIMIMDDGHAVLTDFGLALNVPEGTIGSTFGSVHYIAPEQAMNSAMAVPQSDLYSLGIVLYEMLTGKVPFDDQSAMSVALKHLSDPPPPPRKYNPDITPEVEAVVMRLLDKEPDRRYASGDVMMQALENALGMTDEDEATRQVVIPDWAKERLQRPAPAPAADVPPLVVPGASAREKPVQEASSEKDISTALKSSMPKPQPQDQTRNVAILVVVGVIMVLAVFILVQPAASPASTAVTDTVEPSAVASSTPAAVAAATEEPTTAAPTEPPTEAATQTSAPTRTITRTPAPTETTVPTEVTPVASDMAAPVMLVYDDESFILINQSDTSVDVSGISFVQEISGGADRRFETLRWNGGGVPTSALTPGDCFQIFTTNVIVDDTPAMCNVRQKWDQASTPRWFWISDEPDTRFEVRRDGMVLAECRIDEGECLVDVGA
ncbi:MAG: hypothetical protein CL610_00055 [Anaerolineaceae bacterium]|nr:hypothetical protein [Anaerolineaceae bacterium]